MKISFFFVVCLSLWQITLSFDYKVDKAVNHTRLIEKTEGFSQINNVNKPLNRRSLWANKIYPVSYERQLKLGVSKVDKSFPRHRVQPCFPGHAVTAGDSATQNQGTCFASLYSSHYPDANNHREQHDISNL